MKPADEMIHIQQLLDHAEMPPAARLWLWQRWLKLVVNGHGWKA